LAWVDEGIVSSVRNGYYPRNEVDKLLDETMPKVEMWMAKKAAEGKNNNCTLANAAMRREWLVFRLYTAS
jgi:tyrosinase